MKDKPLALTDATVYVDPENRIDRGAVLIHDGTITAVGRAADLSVPDGARKMDCSGCTVMPGFWNSHVHFFERKWSDAAELPAAELQAQLDDMIVRFGFTSVFDLSSRWENTRALRDRIESGEIAGPAIRSTGEGLVSPDALPAEQVYAMMGAVKAPMPEVATVEDALTSARALLKRGVDGIKLFLIAGTPPGTSFRPDLVRAVVDVAHESGKPVFAHPTTPDDVLNAVRSGVDVVAHTTPHGGDWDRRIVEEAAARGTALTPTLALWKYFARHDRYSVQQRIVETAVGQLRAWIEAGGTVFFGTDLGAAEYDPAEEYALMRAAGMDFGAILSTLTVAPAKRFAGSRPTGRIAEGQPADLTVVRGDPADGIAALSANRYVVRGGRAIVPRALRANAASRI